MRTLTKSRRSRKNKSGFGCFKFLLFLVIIIILALFGIQKYNSLDIGGKIKRNQYPLKYQHFVETYAEKNGLDKYLVYAVIRTESKFDANAVSTSKAKGLMQLTDETGTDCANKLKLMKYKNELLFDPETNIRLGCFYLKSLIQKYNSVEIALAAYNGGPGNVDDWIKSHGNSKTELKTIPFSETEAYVEKVIDTQKMYKSIYEVNK